MIVICEECGKKYQIDPKKIKGKKSRRCKFCKTIITVTKPETPTPQPSPATDLQPETGGISAEAAGVPGIAPVTDASPSATATETPPDMDTTEAMAQIRKRGLGLRIKMALMFFVIPLALFAVAGAY